MYLLAERLKKQKRANALLTSENDSQKEFQQILELKIKELEGTNYTIPSQYFNALYLIQHFFDSDSRQKERINYTLTLKTVCNMISGNFEIEDRVKSSNMMQNSTYSQTDDIYCKVFQFSSSKSVKSIFIKIKFLRKTIF